MRANRQLILLFGNSVVSNVWTPRGVVLDAQITTDQLNLSEANLLYEGNAQILSGTVFKMWFSLGYASTGIGYAESLDCIAWTRYNSGAPILTTHSRATVLKSGATYVMFALNKSTGKLDKLTSSDGLAFSVANAGVLEGTGATWDSDGIANTYVWIEGGTWYILYESATSGGPYRIGLASSVNNGVVWTKSASNPVISETGSVSGPWLTTIDGTYHLWTHVSPTLRLPTDIAHYTSTNRVNWTRQPVGLAFPRSDRDEDNLGGAGQAADPTLIEANGATYMIYEGMSNGANATGRLKLVTAPYTLAQLVGTNQGVQAGYKADIMVNGGFERVGAGGADIFEAWVETAGSGTLARTTTVNEFRPGTSGLAAIKLTTGAPGDAVVRQDFTDAAMHFATSGLTFKVSGYARGDGANRGRVRLYANGDLDVTWSTSPITVISTTYTYFEKTFTVTPGQTGFSVYLYSPVANGGVAYFDDLQLHQV